MRKYTIFGASRGNDGGNFALVGGVVGRTDRTDRTDLGELSAWFSVGAQGLYGLYKVEKRLLFLVPVQTVRTYRRRFANMYVYTRNKIYRFVRFVQSVQGILNI